MACTTTAERAEVLAELEALFDWNPPRLNLIPHPKPHKQPSTATRLPAFYDKHFDEEMVVEKVVRYPSLIQVLASVVEDALEAASKTLPPMKGFITAEDREKFMEQLSDDVLNEAQVTNFYDRTTAQYCLKVASTLALHPAFPAWFTLLNWTQAGHSSHYAIMDGQLCFMDHKDKQASVLESMDSQVRSMFEEVRESDLPLATWEMTSFSTGTPDVMTAVLSLGKFAWTFCTDENCDDDSRHQKAKTKEQVGRVIIGPDAKNPPWKIPVKNPNEEIKIHSQRPVTQRVTRSAAAVRPVTRQATRSAVASGSSTIPPPPARASHSEIVIQSATRQVTRSAASAGSMLPPPAPEHTSGKKGKGKKRKRDGDDTTAQASLMRLSLSPEHESPKRKGKKRKVDDEAYKDKYDITAQYLVQQGWAQAVRADSTIFVLHSGNQEIVCLRHRASRTLYVSDVIEPHTCSNPGYGKIHVGIYIAAIQDMMDRWRRRRRQLSESKPPSDGGDSMSGGKDQEDQDHNRGSGSHKDSHGHCEARSKEDHGNILRGSAGGKGPTDGELVAINAIDGLCSTKEKKRNAIHVANNRDVILLYLRYDVYNSPVPASFFRSAPSILAPIKCPNPSFSPRASQSYRLKECLTIVLTSEIGRGATGVAHHGTLKPEMLDGVMPLDVVVKLAFDDEQRYALRSEYNVYCRLKSKRVNKGIATALGLFDDCEGCACALVLLYAGVPLSESEGKLSPSDRKSALRTLKSIHDAGILHGDIRLANILIGDSGVTIIDFGHSEVSNNQAAKDQEMALLRGCLRLEGKH